MAIVLSEADIRQLVRLPALIDAMEQALIAFSLGDVQQPLRTVMSIGPELSFVGVMPAYRGVPAALGAKLVTVAPANPAKGLPSHLATILLMDPSTGELLAVLDGRYITEARTAAVSAAATRALAKGDAHTLAVLGAGVQAHSHVEALRLVREITEIRVWSPTAANRERFADDHRDAAARVVAAPDARTAVRGADIIVTATASASPILEQGWISPGAHICAVGACRPDLRELTTEVVAAARLFVDSRAGALAEAGDIVIPIEQARLAASHIAGEIGELFAGRVAGRRSDREITLFKSLGMAIEDVAAADLAWRRAVEVGLGRGLVL